MCLVRLGFESTTAMYLRVPAPHAVTGHRGVIELTTKSSDRHAFSLLAVLERLFLNVFLLADLEPLGPVPRDAAQSGAESTELRIRQRIPGLGSSIRRFSRALDPHRSR